MIQSPKPEAGRQRPNKKPGSFSLPQANQRQKTHQPPKTPAYCDSQAASDLRPSFFDPLLRNPALSPIIPQFSYFEKPFFQNTDGILTVSPAGLPIQCAGIRRFQCDFSSRSGQAHRRKDTACHRKVWRLIPAYPFFRPLSPVFREQGPDENKVKNSGSL